MEWLLGECRAHADNTHQQCKKLNTKMHKQTHTNREETNKILHSTEN